MNVIERHPYWALAAVALLTSVVHTMDYREQLAQAQTVYVERPAARCRLPDQDAEYRVTIEYRDGQEILSSCSIEPRNQDEGPAKTMKRLLNRKRTKA